MRLLAQLTLARKITLLAALALLLGVAVFGALGVRAVNEATETMLDERLTMAGLVGDYLDDALGRALYELAETARLADSAEPGVGLQESLTALHTTLTRLSLATLGVYALDDRGRIISGWPETDPVLDGGAFAAHPDLDELILNTKPAVSSLVSFPLGDIAAVFLTAPMRGEGAADSRTLLAVVDLSQSNIGGFIRPIRLGQTGYVEVVDRNGLVLARTDPGPKLEPFEQSDHSGRFATLLSAGEPTRGVCHTCHEAQQTVQKRDVLAFVPITQAPWGVVIRQSENEALAPAQELRRNLIFFGIALVSVALLLVVVITKDVGGRLTVLTAASRRIAEGDLASPVASPGKDEVAILGNTLNEMRAKLKGSYGELEQKNKELSSLLSIARVLTTTFEFPDLLNTLLAKVTGAIPGADAGVLLLRSVDGDGVRVASACGLEPALVDRFSTAMAKAGRADGKDPPEDPMRDAVDSFLSFTDLHDKIRSSINAAVLHHGEPVGSLIMASFRDGATFVESDQRLLLAAAHYVAIAMERDQLMKEAGEANALLEADRLRSEFISSVSHELRTPLTLIKGCSTSLMRQDVSWDEQTERDFLQMIDDKSDELGDLIDKLLQSAKLEAGALKLDKELVLIPRLAQKVVNDMARRTNNHRFALKFPPSFPVVEADVRCMEQVVRNLVENAIKYSPDDTEVVIAGDIVAGEMVVSVRDHGTGVSPENAGRIFERFYRVVDSTSHSAPGSGLGLFIVRGHIEAHDGKVWVESVPGKGSTFFFSLPLGRDEGDD